jgi:hypothetical protein
MTPPARDPRVSARTWPRRLSPAERETLLLDILAAQEGWVEVGTVSAVARNRGLRMAPGGIRAVLDRLADRGRCERRQNAGTSASYRTLDC